MAVLFVVSTDALQVAGTFEVVVIWAPAPHEHSARQFIGEYLEMWESPVVAAAGGGLCDAASHVGVTPNAPGQPLRLQPTIAPRL
jgi:hypothetical protein